MILLTRGTPGIITVTAGEMAVRPDTEYTIRFIGELTKKVIEFNDLIDISASPSRYSRFEIDMTSFDDVDDGFYDYVITDQDSVQLEVGKMKLVAPKVNPVAYESTPIEYSTYGR